jgi:uncharacterized OB-fold protein
MSKYDPPGKQRPIPVPTSLSAPYWEACARGELTYQVCNACQGVMFPPEPACPHCMSTDLGWARSEGKGTVYSYSVLHREPSANFPLPSVFAIVDVDEGYSMFSSIVECEPEDVRIDMRVEVVFDQISDDIHLPLFRPVRDA